VFLPSYSPELNPSERLWLYLKDNHNFIAETGRIPSLCSYPWLQKVSA